jgi:type VI secretion system protein ImpA
MDGALMTTNVSPDGFAPELGALLAPLDTDGPAGPTLRYDPLYAQIRDARSEDDASLPMGEWTRPLKKADWRATDTLCSDLLKARSKDLQVAAWLTEAWVHRHGLGGLIAGTRVLEGLVRDFWDSVHPLMEDGDADLRAAPFIWANDTLAHALLLHVPLVPWPESAPPFINLYDWQRALTSEFGAGDAEAKAVNAPVASRQDILDQAGRDLRALVTIDDELVLAVAAWNDLAAILDERLGADAPSLAKVSDTLARLRQAVRSLLQERDPRREESAEISAPQNDNARGAPPSAITTDDDDMSEETLSAPSEPLPQAAASGRIGSRAEAYQLLELAAAYLQRTEPHSPTPYLVKRAVTWGRMPLPELMQEVLREEGDLNRYFSMLGVKPE